MTEFSPGDHVVYPGHGTGVIQSIKEKEILGEVKEYYFVDLPVDDIDVMVPIDRAEELGLRSCIEREIVEEIDEILTDVQGKVPSRWHHRRRLMNEKLRTGDAREVAEVVRNLTIRARNRDKGLSKRDKDILKKARKILVSELVVTQDRSPEKVRAWMDDRLEKAGDSDDDEAA